MGGEAVSFKFFILTNLDSTVGGRPVMQGGGSVTAEGAGGRWAVGEFDGRGVVSGGFSSDGGLTGGGSTGRWWWWWREQWRAKDLDYGIQNLLW